MIADGVLTMHVENGNPTGACRFAKEACVKGRGQRDLIGRFTIPC
jgi:hypothetical protein